MSVEVNDVSNGGFSPIFIIIGLWGFFVTVFYMVVAFRAMSAHERLAREIARYVEIERTDRASLAEKLSTGEDVEQG